MPQNTFTRALLEAEKLGLNLPFGVLDEARRIGTTTGFSDVFATTCDQAIELLQENKLLRLADQLHAACLELAPASFTTQA